MRGRAVELLDELIGVVWSRSSWDEQEAYYLEAHAPRIARSDDPEFRWIDQDNERVILKRLRELMSDDEWRILPELIRFRRPFSLIEPKFNRDRPASVVAWTAALARARHEGAARLASEGAARGDQRGGRDGSDASAGEPPPAPEDPRADGRRDDPSEARLRELAELADEGLTSAEEHGENRRRVTDGEAEQGEAMSDDAQKAESPNDKSASAAGGEATDAVRPDTSRPAGGATAPSRKPWPRSAGKPDASRPAGDATPDERESDDEHSADRDTPPDAPSPAPDPAQAAPDRRGTPPVGGAPAGAAMDLRGYAERLAEAGEQVLAGAVGEYAERVRGVEWGELPAVMGVAPAAIAPQMVGAALVRNRLEVWIEHIRNVLIFMPVLWTWLKLQAAVSAYPNDATTTFFDYWVDTGGSAPVTGGTLADAALQTALIVVLLIVVNALLGMLRNHTQRRRDREARRFAAVLAGAEAAGAAHRAHDPQSALAGFAVAAAGLTTELRSVGEALKHSAAPFAESVELARRALTETSEAVAGQQRRLDAVVEQLHGIAGMGDQLGALRAEFALARGAAERSAEALAGIRDSLDPSARDFATAAGTLAQLAGHLQRMTEAMAGTIDSLDDGLESSAGHLREAATSMNTVATRVLDELGDGRAAGRSGGR